MKKNIMTVIILAATVVNMILTIIVVFSVVPAMNKSNALVEKIATIVDLEIDSQNEEEQTYTIDDLETSELKFATKQTINLKPTEGDAEPHYAMLESVTVSYNTKEEDYEKIKEAVEKTPVYVQDIVKEIITEYDKTTLVEKTVDEEAVRRIQEFYNSKAVVKVSLGGFLYS